MGPSSANKVRDADRVSYTPTHSHTFTNIDTGIHTHRHTHMGGCIRVQYFYIDARRLLISAPCRGNNGCMYVCLQLSRGQLSCICTNRVVPGSSGDSSPKIFPFFFLYSLLSFGSSVCEAIMVYIIIIIYIHMYASGLCSMYIVQRSKSNV